MYSPFIIKYQKIHCRVYVVSWKLMWMNLQNWQNYSILLKVPTTIIIKNGEVA